MDTLPIIVRRYLDAYNAKNVEALVSCLAADVVFENVSGGVVTVRTAGRTDFERLARQSIDLFSEREQVVTNCITASDRIAVRIAYRAVVAADLPNGWKAGQSIALDGASFFRLNDGHIAEIVDVS